MEHNQRFRLKTTLFEWIGIALIFGTIMGCDGPKAPEFKRMEGIKVSKLSLDTITLAGKALFYNPNAIGGVVEQITVDLDVNSIPIGTISEELSTKVKGKESFTLPVLYSFPTKMLADTKGGLLSGIFSAILGKTVDVHYKGKITLRIAGVKIKVPIDHVEQLKLRK